MPLKFNPTTGKLDLVNSASGGIDPDTKANILALTPSSPQTALATDTGEFFVWDGSSWNIASLELSNQPNAIDAGAYQSDVLGYYYDALSNKFIYNCVLRGSDRQLEGSIRINTEVSPTTFEIYLRGQWNTIIYNYVIDSTTNYELVHTPFQREIDVRSGNSNDISLSGYPVIQEYQTSAGAYQPPVVISGGSL